MPILAWLITIVATLETMVPTIIGFLQTPPNSIFLGTTHHAGDYFYYLSQFAQGAHRAFTTIDLYTSESIGASMVGWTNVTLGNIFYIFGIPSIVAYQVSVALLTLVVCWAAYKLALQLFASPKMATATLFVFTLFHAFPILRDGQPSYGDYWNNLAVPRVRMPAVPHQLILTLASFGIVYWAHVWWQKHTTRPKRSLIGISLASIVLASLQPALWALLAGSLGLTAIIYGLIHKYKWKQLSIYSTPSIITGLAGILPAFYLTNLFTTAPFVQLKLWEATQHIQFTVGHFISATGPVFLIALLSFPIFLQRLTPQRLHIAIFSIASFGLFLSPIPLALGLSHVRFMSTLTILSLCVIATCGIYALRLPKQQNKITSWISLGIFAMLLFYLFPNHVLTIKLASSFSPTNAYQYLGRGDYQLLSAAGQNKDPNATYLVIWPYNLVFPGLSGKRSFNGHPLLTIDAVAKDSLATQFFAGQMTTAQAAKFLDTHHITHIISYSWASFPEGLVTHPISNGILTQYEVNSAYLKPYSK
jgi:hypothetical protein